MGYKKTFRYMLVLVIGLFLSNSVRSQSIVVQAVPPQGAFTIEDLWSFSVLFSGPAEFPLYSVQISLSNSSGALCTSTSSDFVPSGTLMIIDRTQLAQLQPLSVFYYNSQMQSAVNNNGGYFPAGNYQVDITIFGVNYQSPDGVTAIEIGTSSYSTEIQFLIPPELVFVPNHDTISITELQGIGFSWTPPYPVNPSSNLHYTITFKEVQSGQNMNAAMESNPIMQTENSILGNVYPYPVSAPAFEVGKTYSWNIVAWLDGLSMQTETWDFVVSDDISKMADTATIIYTEPKRKPDGSYYKATNKIVYLRYYEEYQVPVSKKLNYRLFSSSRLLLAGVDQSGNILVTNSPLIAIHKGTNYVTINFSQVSNFNYSSYYFLEIFNDKKEVWYLKVYPVQQQ